MQDAPARGLGSVTQGRRSEKQCYACASARKRPRSFRSIVAYGKQELATNGTDMVRKPVFKVKVAVPCT